MMELSTSRLILLLLSCEVPLLFGAPFGMWGSSSEGRTEPSSSMEDQSTKPVGGAGGCRFRLLVGTLVTMLAWREPWLVVEIAL